MAAIGDEGRGGVLYSKSTSSVVFRRRKKLQVFNGSYSFLQTFFEVNFFKLAFQQYRYRWYEMLFIKEIFKHNLVYKFCQSNSINRKIGRKIFSVNI